MTALVLTVASALLYAASHPPLAWWPLAWVALIPLLVAVRRVRPLAAAVLGALWGIVVGFATGWVLPGMLADYFGLPVATAWPGAVALYLLLAGVQVAGFAAWLSWIGCRRPVGPLLVAAAWGAMELARGYSPVRCPWALLANSQVAFTRLIQIADLAGPYGIGMLVAAANVALGGLVIPALRGARPRRERLGVVAALLAALAYGTWRLATPVDHGDLVPVLVVQGSIERGFQWKPEYARLGVDRYLSLTRDGLGDARLVVWPEYAVSFYLQEPTPERGAILDAARAAGAELVLGGPHYEYGAQRETRYHNSVFLVRDGRVADRYDKQRLIPLAEESVRGLVTLRTGYTPGTGVHLLDARVGRIGALVCWEAMYPDVVRAEAGAGAGLLVNLSNDSWFGAAPQARQHLAFAVLRAVENRRWLVRAAQTGISAVIDPYGRVVAQTGFGRAEVLRAAVRASATRTPYQMWGDAAVWIAVAGIAVATVRAARLTRTTDSPARPCTGSASSAAS